MEYIATFYTHSGAIKYQRYLQNKGVKAQTMPVPRRFSSNCGIAVRFSTAEDISPIISEDMEKVYLLSDGQDRLIYNAEAAI